MEIVLWELVVLGSVCCDVSQCLGCDSLFCTCACLYIEDICGLFMLCVIHFSTSFDLYFFNNPKDYAVAVAQSVRDSHRKRKVGCSNPSRDRPESLNQVLLTPLPSAWQ